MTSLFALLACTLLAGCVRLSWSRVSQHAPAPAAAVEALCPGESGLEQCLQAFGAPLWVQEHPVEGGTGAFLVYGWANEKDLGLRVSVPVTRGLSASFDYERIRWRMRGLVLFFDEAWTLTSYRRGLLRELTRDLRPPPSAPEEEA